MIFVKLMNIIFVIYFSAHGSFLCASSTDNSPECVLKEDLYTQLAGRNYAAMNNMEIRSFSDTVIAKLSALSQKGDLGEKIVTFTEKMATNGSNAFHLDMPTFFIVFRFLRDIDAAAQHPAASERYAEMRRNLLLSLELFCKGESMAEQKFCVEIEKMKQSHKLDV